LAATVRTYAALPSNGVVPSYGYSEVNVAGQTSVSGLVVSGTLEKRGAGTLTLTNLFSAPGTVLVREGSVSLSQPASGALAESFQRGLAFWVDANTNVVVNGFGTVDRWLDVREASTVAPYAYMRAEHDFTAYSEGVRAQKPLRITGGADVSGLSMLDFGQFGRTDLAAAWLPWRNADGTRGVLTNIRAVFAVVSYPNSTGYLLGDWDYTSATPNEGVVHFSVGYEVRQDSHTYYRIWHPGTEAYKGQTYVNGLQVDGSRVPDMLGQVLDVMTASPLTAANFFNVKDIDAYGGTFPLLGGGRLGEVLVYTNALTEAERLGIEGYLLRKWKGGAQIGAQRVAAGATVVTEAAVGTTVNVSGVSGDGLWRKTGDGTVGLTLDAALFNGVIRLESGAIEDKGKVRRPNRLFDVPEQGLAVQADTDRWAVVASASGALTKTGAGELTVTGFPTSVSQVNVNGGTLRLTQALRDADRIEPDTLYNGSFEIFSNHDFHGQWPTAWPDLWGFEPAGNGWTYTGNPTESSSPNAAGIYQTDGYVEVWGIKQPAPDGLWAAIVKEGGGMATTFSVPSAGRYRLVLFTASRPFTDNMHRYNILVDGQTVANVRTTQNQFERCVFSLPDLAAGSHTLAFQGIDEGVDRTSLIDDIRIERIGDSSISAAVPNGTFEVSDALQSTYSALSYPYLATDRGYYTWGTVGNSGWTFYNAGVSDEYTPWLSQRQAPEGTRVAYIHEVGGSMSTTVTFPTNGVYELTYLSAARPYWDSGAQAYHNLYDYQVRFDGTVLAYRLNYKTDFETVTIRLPAITNAPVSKTLSFEGLNSLGSTLGSDRSSLFDDVRVTRLADGNPVRDGGFEVPAGALPGNGDTWDSGVTGTAWTFDTAWASSGITRNGSAWDGPNAPEGGCAAFLRMGYRISQAVTFDAGGYYTLSFMAAGRMRNWPGYCMHDFRVLFNGEQVGYVLTFDETWRRYEFRLPYVKAGTTGTLAFEGINSLMNQLGLGEDHDSFIDDVRIAKQATVSGTEAPGLYKSLRVHLDAGSKLALDFPGRTVFNELIYDGHQYSGTLSAANTPFLAGAGSVYVAPKGTLLQVQ